MACMKSIPSHQVRAEPLWPAPQLARGDGPEQRRLPAAIPAQEQVAARAPEPEDLLPVSSSGLLLRNFIQVTILCIQVTIVWIYSK